MLHIDDGLYWRMLKAYALWLYSYVVAYDVACCIVMGAHALLLACNGVVMRAYTLLLPKLTYVMRAYALMVPHALI